MVVYNQFSYAKNIVELFKKNVYEPFVLEMMNRSKGVFPGKYAAVIEQSHGECDFEDINTGVKYDAKLPLEAYQVEMLTSGKRHEPLLTQWLQEMSRETSYNPIEMRDNPNSYIASTKLYTIIRNALLRNKQDENLVFFLPYPITFCVEGSIFMQFASDFLTAIANELSKESLINNRKVFAIYPSDKKNTMVLREIGSNFKEYIESDTLSNYFTYEIVGINAKD